MARQTHRDFATPLRHFRRSTSVNGILSALGIGPTFDPNLVRGSTFQEEHRRLPKELNESLPRFLTKVPLDPLTGKPLLFRPEVISYKLYSVGPNGTDDGGLGDDFDLSYAEYQYWPKSSSALQHGKVRLYVSSRPDF